MLPLSLLGGQKQYCMETSAPTCIHRDPSEMSLVLPATQWMDCAAAENLWQNQQMCALLNRLPNYIHLFIFQMEQKYSSVNEHEYPHADIYVFSWVRKFVAYNQGICEHRRDISKMATMTQDPKTDPRQAVCSCACMNVSCKLMMMMMTKGRKPAAIIQNNADGMLLNTAACFHRVWTLGEPCFSLLPIPPPGGPATVMKLGNYPSDQSDELQKFSIRP